MNKLIIKSGKRNWSGKEFSQNPAKLYSDFDDVVAALNSYHFFKYDEENGKYVFCEKDDTITIIPLSEKQIAKLIEENKVRY